MDLDVLLIVVAGMIALEAVWAFGKLGVPPTGCASEDGELGWASKSLGATFAGVFAGAAGFLADFLEDHGGALVVLAVLGPFAAMAWEQRFREMRVYQPAVSAVSKALRRKEAPDRSQPDVAESDAVPVILQH